MRLLLLAVVLSSCQHKPKGSLFYLCEGPTQKCNIGGYTDSISSDWFSDKNGCSCSVSVRPAGLKMLRIEMKGGDAGVNGRPGKAGYVRFSEVSPEAPNGK